MDMIYENNYTRLCGTLAGAPAYSHTGRGQVFYSFPLEVRRLSGNTDTVNIVVSRERLEQTELCDEPDENTVRLTGALCKEPNLRITPMGRDICDLMLAVNRRYGRSDYLPCICWGLKAREAATWMVGTQVKLEGRIQSRRYIKMTEDGPVERTAFEVSVIQAEAVTAALKTEALQ